MPPPGQGDRLIGERIRRDLLSDALEFSYGLATPVATASDEEEQSSRWQLASAPRVIAIARTVGVVRELGSCLKRGDGERKERAAACGQGALLRSDASPAAGRLVTAILRSALLRRQTENDRAQWHQKQT